MMNKLLKSKVAIKLYYIIQIILLAIGFYLLSSKITVVPWNSPLTTYVLLYLLILVVLQFLLFILYWRFLECDSKYLKLRRIAFIHLLILLLMCFLSIWNIPFFLVGCMFFSLINIYLIYLTFISLNFHLK